MSASGISMHPSVKSLESVVKRVRDILRKGDGITDMDSMAHCMLFTAARMLDTATAKKLNVPYTWDSVFNSVNTKDINGADKAFKDILEILDSKFNTNEFTWKLKAQDDFEKIVRAFNEIDIHEVAKHTDVLGFIYEQHISTGSGGGRDLGKFYTDRLITRYLSELLGSDITAGRPDSMCDATMGTGGFILSYIEMVTKMCPDVKWDDYDIAGGDIDDKVAAIARLNVFLRTGKLFPMIRKRNTLKNDIGDSSEKRRTFKRLLMNIPFGVKGLTLKEDCCDRVKEIVKAGTKSEPLFLALCCKLLAEDGKAAVIVPDGVLVNSSKQHDEMRKHLLDNYNLKRVIKMRGKFFMNTGIQPSVIVFENTGKTTAVEFWDVEKKDSGQLVETLMLTVPRENFDASYSFDIRKYQEVNAVANLDGFPMMRLEEVCDYVNGKTLKSSDKMENGQYDVMGGGMDYIGKTISFNREGETISVSKSGASAGFIAFHHKKYWAGDCFTISPKNMEKLAIKFLYYYLKLNNDLTMSKATGSTIPHCKWDDIKNTKIPLPPLEIQQEIVTALDLIYNNAASAKAAATSVKAQMAAVVRSVGARGFERKKLGDICDLLSGKGNNYKQDGDAYPYYDSNGVTGTRKDFCFEGDHIITARKMSIGAVHYATGKFWSSDNTINICVKDTSILLSRFFYNWLHLNSQVLKELSSGIKPGIRKSDVSEILMPVPPLPIQHEILAILNKMEARLTVLEQMAADAEQEAKYILDGYLTPAAV